jgi:hypothetical protein
MDFIEVEAKTVDDAITEALIKLEQPVIKLNMKL